MQKTRQRVGGLTEKHRQTVKPPNQYFLFHIYLSFRISTLELKDGGLRKHHYFNTDRKIVFNSITVWLGPSGGYNCFPGRKEPVLADISRHSLC